MTKQTFNPSVPEDLNRPYKVTLTEGQIATILYVMEGYIQGNDDYDEDSVFFQDCEDIFKELETVSDNINKPQTFIPKIHANLRNDICNHLRWPHDGQVCCSNGINRRPYKMDGGPGL